VIDTNMNRRIIAGDGKQAHVIDALTGQVLPLEQPYRLMVAQ
jgi:hypothetical protein